MTLHPLITGAGSLRSETSDVTIPSCDTLSQLHETDICRRVYIKDLFSYATLGKKRNLRGTSSTGGFSFRAVERARTFSVRGGEGEGDNSESRTR